MTQALMRINDAHWFSGTMSPRRISVARGSSIELDAEAFAITETRGEQ